MQPEFETLIKVLADRNCSNGSLSHIQKKCCAEGEYKYHIRLVFALADNDDLFSVEANIMMVIDYFHE